MYYQRYNNGYKIQLKIVPNSQKNQICGVVDADFATKALRIKVAAVPENDKANKELINFLSKEWKLAKSDMVLLSGDKSHRKLLYVIADEEFEKKLPQP
ncbi:MAG: hypothetical protein COV35_01775 [Alphaproteobacteria bacterium CG11_big_fil_rev_8_21_14_0_20_39_49]|nr:MAG: hypothetical protein COV35_01775 [Alphaproteobacteria bacterium CG11_big_fil_rev_8_21_14_0_20_39_49]